MRKFKVKKFAKQRRRQTRFKIEPIISYPRERGGGRLGGGGDHMAFRGEQRENQSSPTVYKGGDYRKSTTS